MSREAQLLSVLKSLQCFNCGLEILKPEQSRYMRNIFIEGAQRFDEGKLNGGTGFAEKMKYARMGECWMCQPLKDFIEMRVMIAHTAQ